MKSIEYRILATVYFSDGKICKAESKTRNIDEARPKQLKEYYKRYYFDRKELLQTVFYNVYSGFNIISGGTIKY